MERAGSADSGRGSSGSAEPHPLPQYLVRRDGAAGALLGPSEELTALCCGDLVYCLGTSLGRVHVLTVDGRLVVSFDGGARRPEAVVQLGVSADSGSVLALLDGGRLECWDWQGDFHATICTGQHGLTNAFAASVPFQLAGGSVFLARRNGSLVRRTLGGLVTRHQDTTLFTCSSSLLNRLFRSDTTRALTPSASLVRHLCADLDFLVFACGPKLYCFSHPRQRVTATFQASGGATQQNGAAAGGGGGDAGDSVGTDEGGAPSTAVPPDQAEACIQSVQLSRRYVVVQDVASVCLFVRAGFEAKPFDMVRRISLEARSGQRVCLLGEHMLLASGGADRGTTLLEVLVHDGQILQRLETEGTGEALLQSCAVEEVAASRVDASHAYVVTKRSVEVVRLLRCSEQVLWLLRTKRFSLAMHLAQRRYNRPQALIEIANAYACDIWAKGKLVEAMRIWGESVLPVAPAAYWDEFVRRLDEAGRIDLVVPWLPFNDRSKVSPLVYEKLLLDPLQGGLYLKVLSRVSRWPVRYPLPPLIDSILDELAARHVTVHGFADRQGGAAAQEAEDAGRELEEAQLLLVTLFKLFEFENAFIEAVQVLRLILQLRALGVAPGVDGFVGDNASYRFALEKTLASLTAFELWSYVQSHSLWALLCVPEPAEELSGIAEDVFVASAPGTPAANQTGGSADRFSIVAEADEAGLLSDEEHRSADESAWSPILRHDLSPAPGERFALRSGPGGMASPTTSSPLERRESEDVFQTPRTSPVPIPTKAAAPPPPASRRKRRLFSDTTNGEERLVVPRSDFLQSESRQRILLKDLLGAHSSEVFHCIIQEGRSRPAAKLAFVKHLRHPTLEPWLAPFHAACTTAEGT